MNLDEENVPPQDEAPEAAPVETPQDQEAEDELTLELEGEDPVEETPIIRQLREQLRDRDRELHEHRSRNQPVVPAVGPKPTLEGCEWDEDKFEAQLTAWHEAKRQADSVNSHQREQEEIRNREFERLQINHRARAQALKITDFDAAEKALIDAIGPELAGAALVTSKDSAKLVAAVGKNPAALAKLAAEQNPLLKLRMLWDFEGKINVRKKPPAPEADTIQRGTAPMDTSKDTVSDRLYKEAEKSGDWSAYLKRQRELRRTA
jgi:hypothetical protein